MGPRFRFGAALLIVLTMAGCRKEPTFQGKPLSDWMALSRDADEATQRTALDALEHIQAVEPSSAVDARIKELNAKFQSVAAVNTATPSTQPATSNPIFSPSRRAEADASKAKADI